MTIGQGRNREPSLRVGYVRFLFSVAALMSALAANGSPTSIQAAEAPRPNFLVILCDDLGYGDLSCYGHPAIKTPHLDQLASEGIRFTDCYSASPVCSPSRAGLLTGRTPSRVGVYDWIPSGHPMHLKSSELTIATLLKRAGYATCHVGKWHLNGQFNKPSQPQPDDHGFDHWMSTQNNAAPSHANPTNFVRNGQAIGKQEGYSCQVVAAEAIHWLREIRDPAKPFFQFVCFHEPHEPIASPPELVDEYPDAKKKGAALYYANVANMDRAVGKLLQALDDLKLADDTLVVFTSDNGPETLDRYPNAWRSHGSPGPLRGMKLHLYEGGIRVPGIVRWPGTVKAGQTLAEPVCSVDLLPTFCDLAGGQLPQDRQLDGQSITPLLRGETFERQIPLYWHYFRALTAPKAALRVGDFMVLGHGDATSPRGAGEREQYEAIPRTELVDFELYDLKADLNQATDLAGEDERTKALSAKLKQRYRQVQAEGPQWTIGEKK